MGKAELPSIEDQLEHLKRSLVQRCQQPELVRAFVDAETSGAVWERPGLQSCLASSRTILFSTFLSKMLSEQYLRDLGAKTKRGLMGNAREGKVRATAPVPLAAIDQLTKRVLSLVDLLESQEPERAREALRRYLRGGQITLTQEQGVYIARAELVPLKVALDHESSGNLRCPELVARACNSTVLSAKINGLRRDGFRSPRTWRADGSKKVVQSTTACPLPVRFAPGSPTHQRAKRCSRSISSCGAVIGACGILNPTAVE